MQESSYKLTSKDSNPRHYWKIMAGAVILLLLVLFFSHTTTKAPEAPVLSEVSAKTDTTAPTAAEKTAPPAKAVTSLPKLSSHDEAQMQVLKQILSSHNDSDPRMDSELKVLSEPMKAHLRALYKSLPAEKLNDKGTLVFLLGRNLSSTEDFDFFKDVLAEPPCLSVGDCSRADNSADREHSEHDTGSAVTLAYPQLVGLQALANFAKPRGQDALTGLADELIASATHSPVQAVSKMAENLHSQAVHR